MKENILAQVLSNDGTINQITELIDKKMDNASRQGRELIVRQAGLTDDKQNYLLDDMAGAVILDVEQRAFYLGIDWILKLLGKEGILEHIPEDFNPTAPEPFKDMEVYE